MTTDFTTLPVSSSVRLIDFDEVQIKPGIVPKTFILIVTGTKPYMNMKVELIPLVYIRQPVYWGIEVTGTLPGIGLPAVAPHMLCIPLDGIRGTKGIEVIGANAKEQIDIPCGA